MKKSHPTAWETSSIWYDKIVGTQGHYYHQQVIIPHLLRLMSIGSEDALLDLACGQGVLSHHIPLKTRYLGIDAAPSLIAMGKKQAKSPQHRFQIGDLSTSLTLDVPAFTHAICVLAAQNIENLEALFTNAATHLSPGGQFICVINHPCFRIPRQSHWEVDPQKKLQYRRIDRYLSPLAIPIQTHPSEYDRSPQTLSFHRPLSTYSAALKKAGFVLTQIEEWCSDKQSVGKTAAMENRCRQEFPLFLTWVAQKGYRDSSGNLGKLVP